MTGSELITAERQRQIEVIQALGHTPEHDDKYIDGELALAAQCYVMESLPDAETADASWPWDKRYWNPSDDPIRNLVKAGALIAAEIDRLQRATEQESE